MNRLISNCLYVLLLGCSHHAGAAEPVQIAMYGDSTMLGLSDQTGTYAVTTKNAPAQLQQMLQASGYNAVTINHGVVSTTAANLLLGTNGIPQPWMAEMANSTAQIVVINMGTNDAPYIQSGYETIASFTQTYTQLVQLAQQAGKIVFVESPNPRTDSIPDTVVQEVAQAEYSVTAATGATFIGSHARILQTMPNWQQHLPDGLHPDDTLYTFKASVEMMSIAPTLPIN